MKFSRRFHRKRYRIYFLIVISTIFFSYFFLYFSLPSINIDDEENSPKSNEFFWTIWTRNASEFRARRRLVLDSLLIHHPRSTIRIFSPTLNDSQLFHSYRQRGYRIFVVNCSSNEYFPWRCVFNKDSIVQQQINGIYFQMNSIFLKTLPNDQNLVENPIDSIFDHVDFDTSLQLADLTERLFTISFSDDDSQHRTIVRGSLIDLLLHRYDLSETRSSIISSSLIHPFIYIVTRRKQGRFNGRDVIYLRTKTIDQRWNLSIDIVNGTIIFPIENQRFIFLNQFEINWIFHRMIYQPLMTTTIDKLTIELRHNEDKSTIIKCVIPIRIFYRSVSILTKTMGTEDRWPIVQRFVNSVEKYFSQTPIHIASDSGQSIDRQRFLNSSIFDRKTRDQLEQTMFIHDLPFDSGLSRSRNHLLDQTKTPFVFIIDDDFVFEDDSHLDFLLEILSLHSEIDLIGGKIPEDIEIYQDFVGYFLFYNETIELVDQMPSNKIYAHRYEQSEGNPCRQVDFISNVFLSRTEILRSIRWDDNLKLAEHEDFFLRFAQSNRTVFTCRYISIHHRQEPWWKQIEHSYYKQRSRVYQFYQQMLIKHRFRRLITFNVTNLDLDDC